MLEISNIFKKDNLKIILKIIKDIRNKLWDTTTKFIICYFFKFHDWQKESNNVFEKVSYNYTWILNDKSAFSQLSLKSKANINEKLIDYLIYPQITVNGLLNVGGKIIVRVKMLLNLIKENI